MGKLKIGFDLGAGYFKIVVLSLLNEIIYSNIIKTDGQTLVHLLKMLKDLEERFGDQEFLCGISGTAAKQVANFGKSIFESQALIAAFNQFFPDTDGIIEMGKVGQRFFLLTKDDGQLVVDKFGYGDSCASGGGGMLEYMVERFKFEDFDEFINAALGSTDKYIPSARCGVFAESGIVSGYQMGRTKEAIAAGLCEVPFQNFFNSTAKNTIFTGKVAFIGGVALNEVVIKSLEKRLGFKVFVPSSPDQSDLMRLMQAIGCAMLAQKTIKLSEVIDSLKVEMAQPCEYPSTESLSLDNVKRMVQPPDEEISLNIPLASLGIDIGSVSTKGALIFKHPESGKVIVLADEYLRTEGAPLQAVKLVVASIDRRIKAQGYKIDKIVVATTGSGRHMSGFLISAHPTNIINEISAQLRSLESYLSKETIQNNVISIVEIGGQDSKYIESDHGVPNDPRMNDACAAGTGSFFERQAQKMGIDLKDIGRLVIDEGDRPLCGINATCTILTELSLLSYIGKVSIANILAGLCISSVNNYLKTTKVSKVGDIIVFQGAVARNLGMPAALAARFKGKKVIIPPFPHLTGAIGCALYAYDAYQKNPESGTFRGFEEIAAIDPKTQCFDCDKKGCGNHCTISYLTIGNDKYYMGDRCGDWSRRGQKRTIQLPDDLFALRRQMMESTYLTVPVLSDLNTIGISEALLNNSYGPLFYNFLVKLGFKVVTSGQTSREIVNEGVAACIGGPCFPIKVANGHAKYLVKKGIKTILLPRILTNDNNYHLEDSKSCPLVQAGPEICDCTLNLRELGVKILSPELYFDRGVRHLEKVFVQLAVDLGKDHELAKTAFQIGLESLNNFRQKMSQKGKEILKNLDKNQKAFVVLTRPYGLDPYMNLDVGEEIRKLGIQAIPQDFLTWIDINLNDPWKNIYSTQIQIKLAMARLIQKDPRLEAVVISYFACGPDAYANQFMKKELSRFLIVELDEHSAPANVITRLEAFLDAVLNSPNKVPVTEKLGTIEFAPKQTKGRIIYFPYVNDWSHLLAACLRACGQEARALKPSPDQDCTSVRVYTHGNPCLPQFITAEDILYNLITGKISAKEAAVFMGNSKGPCRFGYYATLIRLILDAAGFKDTPIVTLGARGTSSGVDPTFAKLAWDTMLVHDLLQKMLLRVRPYEAIPGASQAIFDKYIQLVIEILPDHKKKLQGIRILNAFNPNHLQDFSELLESAQKEFSLILPSEIEQRKPLIGIVGEWYVRSCERANKYLIRMLESLGAEVWLAPMNEFLAYTTRISAHHLYDELCDNPLSPKSLIAYWGKMAQAKMISLSEHQLYHVCLPLLKDRYDIDCDEVIKRGRQFVSWRFGGEAICSLAKADNFGWMKLNGLVNCGPFKCMPTYVVEVILHTIQKKYPNLPIINAYYDGFADSLRDLTIQEFMIQAHRNFNKNALVRA